MNSSYSKAYKLLGRSGKEAAWFIAAGLVSSGLYVLVCGLIGLEGAYAGYASFKDSPPLKGLIAGLPGDIFTAWFAAGLAGRFTMDALSGAPEGMLHYAKGWFLRKVIADTVVMGLIWGPVMFLIKTPSHSTLLTLCWILGAGWLSLRLPLWLNASVAENLGLFEAMKRSYTITSAQVLRIIILAGAPLILAGILSKLLSKILPGQTVPLYYFKSLLDSAAAAFTMGIFAVLYLELRSGTTATEPKAAEETPA